MTVRRGTVRAGWLLTGLVMWGAVFVLLFQVWQRRSGESVPGQQQAETQAGDLPAGPAEEQAASEMSDDEAFDDLYDENGRPKSIEVTLTWPEEGVADFSFTDRSGKTITKNDLLGRPWVAGFVFTSCAGPCPRVTLAMKTLQKRYAGRPVSLVTFTVDPKRDTPEVLAKYADFYEADPDQWFFLTGDRDRLYGLINGSFLMPVKEEEDPDPGFEILHTTNLCLVDASGRVAGKYNSLKEDEMARLQRDLDRLLETRVDEDGSGNDSGAEADSASRSSPVVTKGGE